MAKDSKRDPNALYCDDPSLTKQAFAEECDINEILRRAANGQDVSNSLSNRIASYGDFTDMPDFREAMNTVAEAQSMFMQLDWRVRERFNNDPGRLIEFLQDEDNRGEAEKLGLVKPKERTPVVDAVTPSASAAAGKPALASGGKAPKEPKNDD